jgi:hypothetical protein
MTTPSTATRAERFPPLTHEQREAAARRRKHREATADAALAQVLHLRTVTTKEIYYLAEPIRPTIDGYRGYRLEALRVRVTRHPGVSGARTGPWAVISGFRPRVHTR